MSLKIEGIEVDDNDIKILEAKNVIDALHQLRYFKLHKVLKNETEKYTKEIVIFDVEVEVPQYPINEVKAVEPIAVEFYPREMRRLPEVLALREDFPVVPHLNLRDNELPRSICLFEEHYEEIKLRWTPSFFLNQIREWLRLTARGELHRENQPLETMLFSSPNKLFINENILIRLRDNPDLLLSLRTKWHDAVSNHFEFIEVQDALQSRKRTFIVAYHMCSPQIHGTIYQYPRNIKDLSELLSQMGLDLVSLLGAFLKEKYTSGDEVFKQFFGKSELILFIHIPKKRESSSEIEAFESWLFWIQSSIAELGKELGFWGIHEGEIGIYCSESKIEEIPPIELSLITPISEFSLNLARVYSGQGETFVGKGLIVGVGALGSQVFINLIRKGFGKSWTLVDHDYLFPHNLARHALFANSVGKPKVEDLSQIACSIVQDGTFSTPLHMNVLSPKKEESEKLEPHLAESDLILDFSTSIAVERLLASDLSSPARRISAFLNPKGTDLVLLVEDFSRTATLDILEMQYYRALYSHTTLNKHLDFPNESIRYGVSCRDISSVLCQDFVGLYAAIASSAIAEAVKGLGANILIWTSQNTTMEEIHRNIIPVQPTQSYTKDGWTIVYDKSLVTSLQEYRLQKLPNETGGVLIGNIDLLRKKIYVVDGLPAPKDSIERPYYFVRGCQNLRRQVERISQITAGHLTYVGEWHSHPFGASVQPSGDDINVLNWIYEHTKKDACPALIYIVGDEGKPDGWTIKT